MRPNPILLATALIGALSPVLGPTRAWAQPAPDAASSKAEAKAHYEKGQTHYNLGEFDEAVTEFKAAYNLSSAPGLLFNIAQSYRLKKDYEQASYFYKTYLRLKPDASNRADVEARIAEMDKMIADQKAMGASPPQGTIPPDVKPADTKAADGKPAGAPAHKPDDDKSSSIKLPTAVTVNLVDRGESGAGLQTAGLATAGAGAALLITGAVFGKMASSAASDLTKLNNDMGQWTQQQQDKYDAGKRDNMIATISFIAGGAAVATGAGLWLLGRARHHAPSVAVVPTPRSTTVAVGWSF